MRDVEFLLVVALTPAVAVVALVLALNRRPAPAPSRAAEAARRHALTVNVAAWAMALLAGPVVLTIPAVLAFRLTGGSALYAGALAGLWPAVLGLLFLGVHVIGERTWPRPSGTVRRAHLAPRDSPAGPRWLRRLTWTWAALLLVTLVVAGVTASNGRAVTVATGTNVPHTASPYPGWYYGIPLMVAAALLLVATEGVLRLIGRRPAVVDADPAYDAASRRLSAHRALRGTQLVLAGMSAGVLVVMGTAVLNVGRNGAGAVLIALGALVAVAGLTTAAVPAQPAVTATTPHQDP